MSNLTFPIKDVAERLDYAVNWTKRLDADETIVSSEFAVVSGGMTISSQTFVGARSIVWLESGTAGQTGKVACKITTSANRIFKIVVGIDLVDRAG